LTSAEDILKFQDDFHHGTVTSVTVFSPPEHSSLVPMVITGCDDSTAIVWDLHTGKKMLTLKGEHQSRITAVAVYHPPVGDPSSAVVLTASSDKSVVRWNLGTGEVIEKLKGRHAGGIKAMVIYVPAHGSSGAGPSPLLLTGGSDKTVVVSNLTVKDELMRRLLVNELDAEGSEVNALAVYEPADHSAEPIVITGNEDGTVNMWDPRSGQHLRCLTGDHKNPLTALSIYAPLNRNSTPFVVTACNKGTAVMWDIPSGRKLRVFTEGSDRSTPAMTVYAPLDGSHAPVVITAGQSCVRLRNLNARQSQRSIEGGHAWSVRAVAVYVPHDPEKAPLVFTGDDVKTIIAWDLRTGRKHKVLGEGHTCGITALGVYNPSLGESGTPRLVSTSEDGTVAIWDLPKLQKVLAFKAHSRQLNALAIYAPGALMITGSNDCTAHVWDLLSGKPGPEITNPKELSPVTALAVLGPTEQNRSPWVLTGRADSRVAVFELETGTYVGISERGEHSGDITCIVVHSPHDTASPPMFLTACNGEDKNNTIVVWNAVSRTVLGRITTGTAVRALAVFVPQDNPWEPEVLVSGMGGCLSVWELHSDFAYIRSMDAIAAHGNTLCLALHAPSTAFSSPFVVAGCADGAAMLWDCKSGRNLHVLDGGHGEHIIEMGVYQPPDPKKRPLLVTRSCRAIVVADIETGRRVRVLPGDAKKFAFCSLAVYSADDRADDPRLQTPLVFCSTGSSIDAWNLLDGAREYTMECGDPVHKIKVGTRYEGRRCVPILLSGGACVNVWDICSRTTSATITTNYAGKIGDFALVADDTESDTLIATCECGGGTIDVWSYTTKTLVHKISTQLTPGVGELLAAGRSRIVAVGKTCAQVWDIHKGELLHSLSGGHTDLKTAAVFMNATGFARGNSLLVTGDRRGLLTVWDLRSGKPIRTMEGYSGVTALCTSNVGDSSSSGLIFAATNACAVDVWADCLTVEKYMPLPSTVKTVLDYEIARLTSQDNDCAWSRIVAMSDEYGDAFWLENYSLFTNVIERQLKSCIRDSFYKTFKSKLSAVVHLLPQVLDKDKGTKKSLLEVCIDDNLPIRGIVLDAWSAALNTPHTDFVNQVFHPCTSLQTAGLIKLADRFPAEFIDFICRIKLLKSHPMAHLNCTAYSIGHKSGLVVEGLPSKPQVDMWSTVAGYHCSKNAAKDPTKRVTAFVLPLIGAADLDMLNAYVNISNTTDNLAIFESDVGITAFRYAWTSFGLRAHIAATVRYFVFIAIYTLSVFLFDRLQRAERLSSRVGAWFLQAAVLCGALYYTFDEYRQFWNENKERVKEVRNRPLEAADDTTDALHQPGQHRQRFTSSETYGPARAPYTGLVGVLVSVYARLCSLARRLAQAWEDNSARLVAKHFSGFWNFIDLSVICIVVTGTITRIWNGHETDASRCILSVGSVLVWFKVLNFMRPFKRSGPLSKFHRVSTLITPTSNRISLRFLFSCDDTADHARH
jgi:WD40 repeat protein